MAPPLDGAATGRGLVVALAVVVPAAVAGQASADGSLLRSLSLLGVLAGLAAGGFQAGRAAGDGRLPAGAAAGAAAYLVVQGVGVLLRIGRGEAVAWLGIPFLAALSASVGMLGAWASGLPRLGGATDDDGRADDGPTRRSDEEGQA